MIILGIDYGLSKIGLAIGDERSRLAEPLVVVRVNSLEDATLKVGNIANVEQVEKIVIGVSENEMAAKSKEFGTLLQEKLGIDVIFQDETLTTHEAQSLSMQTNMNRKKRKAMEDAYAAALILQEYLDGL